MLGKKRIALSGAMIKTYFKGELYHAKNTN
jgi:hypothetical protein